MRVRLHDLQFAPYISEADVHARIAEMGAALSQQFKDKEPVFIVILNGAFMFGAALLQQYAGLCTVHFTRVQSYTGTQAGAITAFAGLPDQLAGKDVIIVEDIIDSGNTVAFLLEQLKPVHPASVTTVALLQKDIPRTHFNSADMTGFVIPDVFVVGFGLDYDQLGRNLPSIYQLIQ
jgi:hypoxanthine phosphoribosyltransferase